MDAVSIIRCMHESLSNCLGRLARGVLSSGDGTADVGEDTSFSDGGVVKKFVEFLVVSDGEEDVPGDDSGLLVVLGGISSQFEDLSSQIFEDGCEIDGGSSSDSFGVVSMSKETANSSDGELEASPGGLGHCL